MQKKFYALSGRRSADHPPVPLVNRDASRSFAGYDIGERARHAEPGRDGSPDSAGRRHAVPCFWSGGRTHQRSRCAHDRNGCRSPPGCGSRHKETAAPGLGRPDPIGKTADDQRGNNCDIAPACVPRHGVVHGAEANLAVWARRRAYRQCCGPSGVDTSHLNPALSSASGPAAHC
jgi:hypothetical protein